MLEVADELPARAFDLDDLGVNLDLDTVGDVHGLGGEDRLHLRCCSGCLSLSRTAAPVGM